jgi:hypothetical protein
MGRGVDFPYDLVAARVEMPRAGRAILRSIAEASGRCGLDASAGMARQVFDAPPP